MKMKLLVLAAFAATAWAQQGPQPPPPGQQPRNVEPRALKAYLGLTDEQLMQMGIVRAQARKAAEEKIKGLQPQMEQKHLALQELMNRPNADPAAVGKALLEVRAMERQMREVQESTQNSGLGILTGEQRTKFKQIQDAALLPQATREAIGMGLVTGMPGDPSRKQQWVHEQFMNQQGRKGGTPPQPSPPQPPE